MGLVLGRFEILADEEGDEITHFGLVGSFSASQLVRLLFFLPLPPSPPSFSFPSHISNEILIRSKSRRNTDRSRNSLGDWIMAWAWCLPTGFSSALPYFYVVYFAILLVHRQMRDDEACEGK